MSTSSGLEPGDNAAKFSLFNANSNVGSESMDLSNSMGEKGLILTFTCNHCPYVVGSEARIESIAVKARENGFGFIGINSNDPVNYESDSWKNMVKRANKGMTYPYLHDDTQTVATAYGAERTPEFYMIDQSGKIVYRGRLDDSPRDPSHATTADLSNAIDAIVNGKEVQVSRTESIGCSIKWN